MKPSPNSYLPLLERAMEQEIGICIAVNNPKLFRAEILALIKSNPEYSGLITFCGVGGESTVWICRKSVELES